MRNQNSAPTQQSLTITHRLERCIGKIERIEIELSRPVGWPRLGIELDNGKLCLVTSIREIDDLVSGDTVTADDAAWVRAALAAHLQTYDLEAAKTQLPLLRRLRDRLARKLNQEADRSVQNL